MRSILVALLVVPVMGCDRSPDVVAIAADPTGSSKGTDDTAYTRDGSVCSSPSTLALVTKTGHLARFDLTAKMKLSQGETCVPIGAGPIAIDSTGTIWAQTGGVVVSTTDGVTCKSTGLSLTATAMTFVYDSTSGSQGLYAVVDGVLVVINDTTLARTPIGKLALEDVRGLAGTSDGRLYAFAGGDLVTVAEVARGDASIAASWLVKAPRDLGGRFAGGVIAKAGFELVFGPYAYGFAPSAGTLVLDASIFPDDPGITGIAAAPCFVRTK